MCEDYKYGTCTSLDISSILTDSLFWNQILSKLLAAKDPKAINLPPSVMSVLAWKFVLKMKIPEIFQEWQMSIIQINVRFKLRHIPSIYGHSFKISLKLNSNLKIFSTFECVQNTTWCPPGCQNLAAFRREQKWRRKFSSTAYLQFFASNASFLRVIANLQN